jgi:uncharacterized protein (DUF1697 family)
MRFVALLRGINVGVGRGVAMADLKDVCAGLGWTNVRTYIQSGNVVFEALGDESGLAAGLEAVLAARYAFAIPVLVRSDDRWRELAADRPFEGWTDAKQLSVTLLDGPPDPDAWSKLAPWRDQNDAIELCGDRVWVKTPTAGYGKTKFHNAWLEKQLGRRATTRNRATVDALLGWLTSD